MALATTPAPTINDRVAGWKHEIDQAEKDALWAIFGYDPADPKGSHDQLAQAWNRGHQPTLNLTAWYETYIAALEARSALVDQRLADAGIDIKALLRGELTTTSHTIDNCDRSSCPEHGKFGTCGRDW